MQNRSKLFLGAVVASVLIVAGLSAAGNFRKTKSSPKQDPPQVITQQAAYPNNTGKIQVAVLLDVSNSMDGLIDQAKAQLWNIVSTLGKAECNSVPQKLELALYEYGRDNNKQADGYIKQLTPFTNDLDQVSQTLFSLTTNGGDEYCGHVMYKSLQQLSWDTAANTYKVIFIAGNEDFLQGQISYLRACSLARQKNVIINTIYCGSKTEGISEHWNLNSECGSGSYTNINSNAQVEDFDTPYDSVLFALNDKLNNTYIGYGSKGVTFAGRQKQVDASNYKLNKAAAVKRVSVKGKRELYDNASWDMVDASVADSTFFTKVDKATLPDSLKDKSREDLQKIVAQKTAERTLVQKQIAELTIKREQFIAATKASRSGSEQTATLGAEIEKIIRAQALRYNIVIK
jgi:hypothetical protein